MRRVMTTRALGLFFLLCVLGIALTAMVVAATMPEPGPTPEEVHAEVTEAKADREANEPAAVKDLPPAPEPVDTSGINPEALEAEMQEAMGQYLPTSICHMDRSACDTSPVSTEAGMEATWEASGRPAEPMPESQRAKICAATGNYCS